MISEFRIIVGDSHQSKYERGGSMYQLFCRFLIFQVGLFVSYEQLLGGVGHLRPDIFEVAEKRIWQITGYRMNREVRGSRGHEATCKLLF